MRVISAWFDAIAAGTIESDWFDPQTAGATRRLVVTGIWLFALTIAYPYIPGSETAAFKGVSVFVGLMLSLGSAGALSQIVSGFVVLYSRAIRVGDFVRINDKRRRRRRARPLSLKLVTRLREEVTIPNTVLAGAAVDNYTRRSARGRSPHRGVGDRSATTRRGGRCTRCSSSPHRARRTFCRRRSLTCSRRRSAISTCNTSSMRRSRSRRDRPFVLSRLHAEIQDAFNEFGVQIMSPNFEAQPDAKVWVPREHWNAAPAEKPAA